MDKRLIEVKGEDVIWNDTIHCGNFEDSRLKITVKGVGLDAEDQGWRFLEASDGRDWHPIGPVIFSIINGEFSFIIDNPRIDLMLFRNPTGGLTTGEFTILIEETNE
tara:strand:- start:462 stop:782 length:321 start_codon:yes stop_codon:yes gene_type:complete